MWRFVYLLRLTSQESRLVDIRTGTLYDTYRVFSLRKAFPMHIVKNKMSLTTLRKQLYQVVDRVLKTGVPVEIVRNGKTALIVSGERQTSKLSRLKRRKGIIGDPDALVDIKVGTWGESNNLK